MSHGKPRAERGEDFRKKLGTRRCLPVSGGQVDAIAAATLADEVKLVRGAAVTPGQTVSVSLQATQVGSAPDVFAGQPAHVVEPLKKARGGGHARGTHDANDVGACTEV